MRRPQTWVLLFLLVYGLCLCRALPFYVDEGYTHNLATEASLGRMLAALRDGADGAFPLHPVLVFCWAKAFGASELSLRLVSALFLALFALQTFRQLAGRFRPFAGAVALLVILANERFAFYTLQARGYGLVVCLFSVVFWGAWEMVEGKASRWRRLGHALACGLLCLSHPLGVVYVGIVGLLYVVFSCLRRTFAWGQVAGFICGPLFLLAWLPSFLVQRQVNPVFPPGLSVPGLNKYWEFAFLDSWILFGAILTSAAALLAFYAWHGSGRKDSLGNRVTTAPPAAEVLSGNRLLLLNAFALVALLNAAIASLDWLGIIPVYVMLALRYVLVSGVGFCVILAGGGVALMALAQRSFSRPWSTALPRLAGGVAVVGLLGVLTSFGSQWYAEKSAVESHLRKVSALAAEQNLEVICARHADAFFLVARAQNLRAKYVLPDNYPFTRLMLQMQRYYPRPASVSRNELARFPRPYVFIDTSREVQVMRPEG